jgi:hypothetical protein
MRSGEGADQRFRILNFHDAVRSQFASEQQGERLARGSIGIGNEDSNHFDIACGV